MLKTITARKFNEAVQRASDAGITHPQQQIKRTVRRRGMWFITCEVPA